jgi:endonuclease/exonuclease/phosphatase family metal-dependent hydrolase
MKKLGEFRQKTVDQYKIEPAIVVCGDFNSQPHSSSVSLIYDSQHFAKNIYHQKSP